MPTCSDKTALAAVEEHDPMAAGIGSRQIGPRSARIRPLDARVTPHMDRAALERAK